MGLMTEYKDLPRHGPQFDALKLVVDERERQGWLWGDGEGTCSHPETSLLWLLGVLSEEVGEFAKEIIEGNVRDAITELIQVAAVATAGVEAVRRTQYPDQGNAYYKYFEPLKDREVTVDAS